MARNQGPFNTRNRWRVIGIGVAAGLTLGTGLFGFVILPAADRSTGISFWDAICRSVGLQSPAPADAEVTRPRYASTVLWTPATLKATRAGDAHRGAAIAETCGACHGANGISDQAWIPILAGTRPEATVKQLVDFGTGDRRWGVMNAIARSMTQGQMADVAAFYASLPPPAPPDAALSGSPLKAADQITRLVFAGDPARSVAPCATCHGLGALKRGAPVLAGQHPAYIERQLDAFGRQARHNDEGEQMRVIAGALTPAEMHDLADFMSAHASGP